MIFFKVECVFYTMESFGFVKNSTNKHSISFKPKNGSHTPEIYYHYTSDDAVFQIGNSTYNRIVKVKKIPALFEKLEECIISKISV